MEKVQQVIEEYILLTEKIASNSNKPNKYDTDIDIFRSEIHIISIIGLYKNIHISEIARKFGVTKGAISKAIKKLEKKGLVKKSIDKENNTRTLVELTAKGKIADKGHDNYHNKYDKIMFSFLNSLKEQELFVLQSFLKKANKMADRHI